MINWDIQLLENLTNFVLGKIEKIKKSKYWDTGNLKNEEIEKIEFEKLNPSSTIK